MEQLVQQVEQNLLGLPAVPTVTSIGGVWRHGATLPERAAGELRRDEPAIAGHTNLVA